MLKKGSKKSAQPNAKGTPDTVPVLHVLLRNGPAARAQSSPTIDGTDSKGEFLLEVAAKTFLQEGFAGTSVGEIARRAHASKETLYSRYDSKEQLFQAAMLRLVEDFSLQLDATMAPQDPPAKVLTLFGKKIMDQILSDEGIALQNLVHVESKRFPEVAGLFFESGPQRAILSLGRYLESQVERKKLRPLDGETAAGHFLGILTFDILMRRSAGVPEKPRAPENNQRIKTAVNTFLRAYGPE